MISDRNSYWLALYISCNNFVFDVLKKSHHDEILFRLNLIKYPVNKLPLQESDE